MYIHTIKKQKFKGYKHLSGDGLATSLHTSCIVSYCALLLVNIDCTCMGIAPYP